MIGLLEALKGKEVHYLKLVYFLSTFEIHLTPIPRQKILEKKLYQDREALDLIWILDTTIEIEASKFEKGYYSTKRSEEGEKKETKTKKWLQLLLGATAQRRRNR